MKKFLEKRPFTTVDYAIAAVILLLAILFNFMLWTMQSGLLSVQSTLVSLVGGNFRFVQILAYLFFLLVFLDAMYLIYIYAPLQKEVEEKVVVKKVVKEEPKKVAAVKTVTPVKEEVKPLQQGTVQVFEQKDVKIADVASRKRFEAFAEVENGLYLELEPDFSTSNRVVEVENGVLPRIMHPNGFFVSVTKEERQILSLAHLNFAEFIKFTPGSFKDAGYYLEVDLDNKSTEYYIYTEKRLPPTHKKGYRWVSVTSRKVN